MAKRIEKDQIIAPDIFGEAIKQAEHFLAISGKLQDQFTATLAASEKFFQTFKVDGAQSITAFNKEYKELNDTISKSNNLAKEEAETREAVAKAKKAELNLLQAEERARKANAKEIEKLNSLYAKESDKLNQLRKNYKDLAIAEKENTKEGKALLAQITALDIKLKSVDAKVGQFQRNVGNYGKAFEQVGKSIRGLAGAVGVGLGVREIINFTGELFELGDQLEAVERKSRAVFGDAFPQLQAEAERNANAFGLTNSEYIKAITNLTQLQQNMGFSADEAKRNATEILNTANTLSLIDQNGKNAAEVSEELANALSGQTKSLKQYGIVVDKNLDLEEAQAAGLEVSSTAASQKSRALQILGQVTNQTNKLNVGSIKELTDAELEERRAEAELRQAKEDLAEASGALKDIWTNMVSTIGGLIVEMFRLGKAAKSLDADTSAIGKTFDNLVTSLKAGEVGMFDFAAKVDALALIQKKGAVFTGEFKKEFDALTQSFADGTIKLDAGIKKYQELLDAQNAFNAEEARKQAEANAKAIADANAEAAKKEREKKAKEAKEATDKAFQAEMELLEKQRIMNEIVIEREVTDQDDANTQKLQNQLDYLEKKKALEEKYSKDIVRTELEIEQQKNAIFAANDKKDIENTNAALDRVNQEGEAEQKKIDRHLKMAEDFQDHLTDIDKKGEEDREKLDEKRFNERKQFYDSIVDAATNAIEKENELLSEQIDKNISDLEKQIERQEELADKGVDNMLASKKAQLAQEELRREELRKKEINQQKAIALIKAYISNLDFGDNSSQAFTKAIRDTGALVLADAIFAKDGAEDIKGPGTTTSDSIPAMLSLHESVLNAKGSQQVKGLPTAINEDGIAGAKQWFNDNLLPEMIRSGEVGIPTTAQNMNASIQLTQVVDRLESIEEAIKGQPVQNVNIDRMGNVIYDVLKDGLREIRKTPLKKPRF